jgi:3-phenylpropionate/cinnamic acid dioxygenase small subunit
MNMPRPQHAVAIDRAVAEEFLVIEARLLDERRLREWMELFTEDGIYWVPSTPDQTSPLTQASLFYDDRELMKTRIDRLEHPLIHVQTPPSRTVHLLGNITVEAPDPETGESMVASNVLMVEYRLDRQRLFAGRQRHRLRYEEGRWRIAHKRVDLVNCDSAFEAIALPI